MILVATGEGKVRRHEGVAPHTLRYELFKAINPVDPLEDVYLSKLRETPSHGEAEFPSRYFVTRDFFRAINICSGWLKVGTTPNWFTDI